VVDQLMPGNRMRAGWRMLKTLTLCCALLAIASCGNGDSSTEDRQEDSDAAPREEVRIPAFQRDSAYAFVEQQLAFGPRNPGSEGIVQCRAWIVSKLSGYGAQVIQQDFTANVHTGERYPSVNIIGQVNPNHGQRVILAAHYDTRYMAEEDDDPERRDEPIAGADDGGSGVAVLLEIARVISENPIDLGVDFIFFDAEDQGERQGANETWCLGAQHWSRNPHRPGYRAKYGILLDMVGAKNAFFNKENVTRLYPHANQVHNLYDKVWNLAKAMGKGRFFQDRRVQGIMDDHYFVNVNAGIPMIDIINKPLESTEGFGPHWHTHNDDIDIINKNTLGAVGQVVTAVIYKESVGTF
jgi:glutaminyl-peptide cyclotransferase